MTVIEWLNKLPSPYRERAIGQCNRQDYDSYASSFCEVFREYIYTTKEGTAYWEDICNRFERGQLSPISVEYLTEQGWSDNKRIVGNYSLHYTTDNSCKISDEFANSIEVVITSQYQLECLLQGLQNEFKEP